MPLKVTEVTVLGIPAIILFLGLFVLILTGVFSLLWKRRRFFSKKFTANRVESEAESYEELAAMVAAITDHRKNQE